MSSYGLSLALGVGVEVCGLGHETVVLLTSPAAAAAAAVDAGMRLVPLLVTATIDGNQCSSLRDAARTTRPLQLASSALCSPSPIMAYSCLPERSRVQCLRDAAFFRA